MPTEPKVEVVPMLVDAHHIQCGRVRAACDDEPGGDIYLRTEFGGLILTTSEVYEAHACLSKLIELIQARGIEYTPEED